MKPHIQLRAMRDRIGMLAWMVLTLLFSLGCTVLTDFDSSDGPKDIEEILPSKNITLTAGPRVAVLSLTFSDPLDSVDAEGIGGLIGEEIVLVLADASKNEGVEISRNRVEGVPAQPEEFSVTVGSGGGRILVMFFNESNGVPVVTPGQNVRLLIEVNENDFLVPDIYEFQFSVR